MDNGLDFAEQRATRAQHLGRPHVGVVTSSPEVTREVPGHAVKVTGITFSGELPAQVLVAEKGDTNPPPEGCRVLVQFLDEEWPVIIGQIYSKGPHNEGPWKDQAPTYQPNERRLGHTGSRANIRFESDGLIVLESTEDKQKRTTTVEMDPITGSITVTTREETTFTIEDGAVRVNDSDTGVVTDITTSTDSDGHVTSVSPIRSDTLYA